MGGRVADISQVDLLLALLSPVPAVPGGGVLAHGAAGPAHDDALGDGGGAGGGGGEDERVVDGGLGVAALDLVLALLQHRGLQEREEEKRLDDASKTTSLETQRATGVRLVNGVLSSQFGMNVRRLGRL